MATTNDWTINYLKKIIYIIFDFALVDTACSGLNFWPCGWKKRCNHYAQEEKTGVVQGITAMLG